MNLLQWLGAVIGLVGGVAGIITGIWGLRFGIREGKRARDLRYAECKEDIAILDAEARNLEEWKAREENEIIGRFTIEMYMARLGIDPNFPIEGQKADVDNSAPGRQKQLELNANRRREAKMEVLTSDYNLKKSRIRAKKGAAEEKAKLVLQG